MNEPAKNRVMTRRTLALVLVVAGTAATTAVLLALGPAVAPAGRAALAGATASLAIATSTVAFARHRDTRDPHPLFISAGFAVVGLHSLLFQVVMPAASHLTLFLHTALPSYLWLAGWLVAGLSFLAALPLWERRGRPPIRAGVVFWAAGALTFLLDLAFVGVHGAFPTLPGTLAELTQRHLGALGSLGWIAAGPATAILVSAGLRELEAARAPRSPHPWLAGAFVVAAAGPALLLVHPALTPRLLEPAEIVPPIAAALSFLGLLVHQRADVSRMRRESDRAREITGGRAEIARMVAHEVRGPVSTIRGLSQTASRHFDGLSDPERREFLAMIEQESDRLMRVTDQTSMALKVDARTVEYQRTKQDLGELVREAVDKADAGGRAVAVDTQAGIVLSVDRLRLQECIQQLVDNAAKFSPAAAPIDVRVHRDGDAALIDVSDRGPGIAEEHANKIFQKFPGVRPPGYEEVPGTGLGLFICRAHVREHGGDVSVGAGPDGGTMLRIMLPIGGDSGDH